MDCWNREIYTVLEASQTRDDGEMPILPYLPRVLICAADFSEGVNSVLEKMLRSIQYCGKSEELCSIPVVTQQINRMTNTEAHMMSALIWPMKTVHSVCLRTWRKMDNADFASEWQSKYHSVMYRTFFI